MDNLLSIVTFLPSVAALILVLFLRGDDAAAQRNAKWVALAATGLTFLLAILLVAGFDPKDTGFQFVETRDWILGLKYRMGVDGLSVLFVLMTTFLMPIAVIASWNVTHRTKEYMVALLVLQTLLVGTFCALDMVLFYLFFEGSLIPMFILIGVWGGKTRVMASFKFFLYTFFGSVFMLISMVYMYIDAGTSCMGACGAGQTALLTYQFQTGTLHFLGMPIIGGIQTLLWLGFFINFMVKMPFWPLHAWLPDAHAQAPSAATAILAAVLMKLSSFAFLRFSVPMFPVGTDVMQPLALWFTALAIVYCSIVALVQGDMKRLVAYGAVAHMGYSTMGILSGSQQGIDGAVFQMLTHGLITAALFFCVGVVEDRMKTTEIDAYGGLVNRMPVYALLFMLFTMANIGLPGTSGFVGEFLTLVGIFEDSTWTALLASTGLIFSAGYGLWLYRRVVFGDLVKESLRSITDLSAREKAVFAPLAIVTLVLGIYPALVTDVVAPASTALVHHYETATADFAQARQVASAAN